MQRSPCHVPSDERSVSPVTVPGGPRGFSSGSVEVSAGLSQGRVGPLAPKEKKELLRRVPVISASSADFGVVGKRVPPLPTRHAWHATGSNPSVGVSGTEKSGRKPGVQPRHPRRRDTR